MFVTRRALGSLCPQEEEYHDYAGEEEEQGRELCQNVDVVVDRIWYSLIGQAPSYTPPPDYVDSDWCMFITLSI